MKKILIISFFAVLAQAKIEDPYQDITRTVLPNGMIVYLAPGAGAKTVSLSINVDVGFTHEDDEQTGAAHTLEHSLFRHESLPANMTFLQVIKENGGEANGFTKAEDTTYVATVKPDKANWVVEQMALLLNGRVLTKDIVEKAKKEVLLELGEEDSPIQRFVGFLRPDFFRLPSFWESEFKINYSRDDIDIERSGTISLNPVQVQKFYDKYYKPQNMTVVVAGNFVPSKMMKEVQKAFGSIHSESFEKPKSLIPIPRKRPYIVKKASDRDTFISLGTKFWDISAADELVLRTYLEFVSHRLMKEIRNEKAETYTAYPSVGPYRGVGYGVVSLSTTRDKFKENLLILRKMLEVETQGPGFDDEMFTQAFSLYEKHFALAEADAKTLDELATQKERFLREYKSEENPYQIFASLTAPVFRETLQRLFKADRRYEVLYEPPILFRDENHVIDVVFVILLFLVSRRLFAQNFDHKGIRYVRKVKFSYLTLLRLIVIFSIGITIYSGIHFLNYWVWLEGGLTQNLFLNEYLHGFWEILVLFTIFMGILALTPRKIMVVGDTLYVKSLTFVSRKIPLSQIKGIEVLSPLRAWRYLVKRVRIFHWSIFSRGVVIKFARGGIYLGFRDADKVGRELRTFLPSQK